MQQQSCVLLLLSAPSDSYQLLITPVTALCAERDKDSKQRLKVMARCSQPLTAGSFCAITLSVPNLCTQFYSPFSGLCRTRTVSSGSKMWRTAASC